ALAGNISSRRRAASWVRRRRRGTQAPGRGVHIPRLQGCDVTEDRNCAARGSHHARLGNMSLNGTIVVLKRDQWGRRDQSPPLPPKEHIVNREQTVYRSASVDSRGRAASAVSPPNLRP